MLYDTDMDCDDVGTPAAGGLRWGEGRRLRGPEIDIVLPRQSPPGQPRGFHGDGLLHMELTFSQEDALAVEEAVSSAGWSLFPMEPELEERLYPDGAGASDWPDWPVPARGWWYLEDRQEDETEDMWQWYSYNYTFAVYDPDTGILYYQELDT
ncbi:hypothetical protein M5E87_16145 [Flavonifractor plautii]|nr:hypothetical protein M5E87_16145 [Flavonifractor plautii]